MSNDSPRVPAFSILAPPGWLVRGSDDLTIFFEGSESETAPIVMATTVTYDEGLSFDALLDALRETLALPEGACREELAAEVRSRDLACGMRSTERRWRLDREDGVGAREEKSAVAPMGPPGRALWVHATASPEDWPGTEAVFGGILDSVRPEWEPHPREVRRFNLLYPEKAWIAGTIDRQRNRWARQLAAFLRERGVDPDSDSTQDKIEMCASSHEPLSSMLPRHRWFDYARTLPPDERSGGQPVLQPTDYLDRADRSLSGSKSLFLGRLDLEVSPLVNSSIELLLEGDVTSWDPFESWTTRWIDPEGSIPIRLAGLSLSSRIHRVEIPRERPDGWWLEVDLGSAGSDAFWELLVALLDMGIRCVSLGSWRILEKR